MKHNTFVALTAAAGLTAVIAGGYLACSHVRSTSRPSAPVVTVVATRSSVCPADATIHPALIGWLATHGDRHGQVRAIDAVPGIAHRLTAVRFPPGSPAARFSDNEAQWSQLRLDCDGDGRDDQKWLLRNGAPYKAEDLGPDGASVGVARHF